MEVRLEYVSGTLEKDSTIVVGVFLKGLASKVSLVDITFRVIPKTGFKISKATNDLFNINPNIYDNTFGFVSSPSFKVTLQNKNGIERYSPIELDKSGFLARVDFLVLDASMESEISILEIRLAENPMVCFNRILPNVSLLFPH